MRKLIENVVYDNFVSGFHEIHSGASGTPLEAYLMSMDDLNEEEKDTWLTGFRLRDIKKLIALLSDKQLLLCLTNQHCEKFR